MKSNSKNELVKKLSICGQVAEHKSEKMLENGADENMILAILDDDEKQQLDAILTKLQSAWLADHKEHHSKKAE